MCRNYWIHVFFLLCLWSWIDPTWTHKTMFRYADVESPNVYYETVPYANMTLKINLPYDEGPGQNLFSDPSNPSMRLYVGNTINRQSFDTQFVLDIEKSIGINRNRVYVTYVSKGRNHFSWEGTSVIVQFLFLERNDSSSITLLESIATLTNLIQINTSSLYTQTNVTKDIDPTYGLVVRTWDISLKLSYAIETVGGDAVIDGYFLNQGDLGVCDDPSALNYPSYYCEFEHFFENDIATALNISIHRVHILFVKSAALDSVLVYFRIVPPQRGSNELDLSYTMFELIRQVGNSSSPLYQGNVTVRVDPIWGVSQNNQTARTAESLFTQKRYELDNLLLKNKQRMTLYTAYDRCKANRRCNWGMQELDQSTNELTYSHQLFTNGEKIPIDLYLDFEDWRIGTRGMSWTSSYPPMHPNTSVYDKIPLRGIFGSHIYPFEQEALGPYIPAYLMESNQGLILDHSSHIPQIQMQEAYISYIQGNIEWLHTNIETANMNAIRRSRIDVRNHISKEIEASNELLYSEIMELKVLNSSQCVYSACELLFNTSSLKLTGVIQGTGVIRKTKYSTEIAVFEFNSIYLGPEVNIRVVGQRALGIVSRTSIVWNATIKAEAGTLGGMTGGGSVGRYETDALNDEPRSILISELSNDTVVSNNVNGLGSGSLLISTFVIRTVATYIPEIQSIRTSVGSGQTIQGGFILHFKSYSTSIIPYDASANLLKRILEDCLNLIPPSQLSVADVPAVNRVGNVVSGIGVVNVSRTSIPSEDGYTWRVTFTTAVGNIEQLQYTSLLQGYGTSIVIETIQNGNDIQGSFAVSVDNEVSVPIPYNASATEVQESLLALPSITTAIVTRIDPTGNCDDGLCTNGPLPCHGFIWTCLITTNSTLRNISPTSPTSPLLYTNVNTSHVYIKHNALSGKGARIYVNMGTAHSNDDLAKALYINRSFSLSYGGGGGSYGGVGGEGYGSESFIGIDSVDNHVIYPRNPISSTYNDEKISDLLGGSGGCMRGNNPLDINRFMKLSHGLGGDGGGAIEFVAANDIYIGSYGYIGMSGGAGGQASEGGAGGGSGGAIVLSAGGVIRVDGVLDVQGGDGGFGGYAYSDILAGGGGGGGRIALYAQSITIDKEQSILADGGRCGRLTIDMNATVIQFQTQLEFVSQLPLYDDQWMFIGRQFIHRIFDPLNVTFISLHSNPNENATVNVFLTVNISFVPNEYIDMNNIAYNLQNEIGQSIASVVLYSISISTDVLEYTSMVTQNVYPTKCVNSGNVGTFYSQSEIQSYMSIESTLGAENTSHALFLSNRETDVSISGSMREVSYSWNGPTISFPPSRPSRITFYTRISSDRIKDASRKSNFGSLFSLLSHDSNFQNVSSIIGVFIGSHILHGANFESDVDENIYQRNLITIDEYVVLNRWYKIDIRMKWNNDTIGYSNTYNQNTYTISIDDTVVTNAFSFVSDSIDGIRLSVTRSIDVWYDEIYVGFDNTMEFVCPTTNRTGTQTVQPVQRSWSFNEVHGGNSIGFTAYNRMQRHYNHLTTTGTLPLDGQGIVKDNQDIKLQFADGDYQVSQGTLHAGSLVYITNSLRSGKTSTGRSSTLVSSDGLWYQPPDGKVPGGAGDGRHFWYTEYNYISSISPSLNGGVAACSSQDLITWRFEGIVFHYANLSDMVYGSKGPFTVERPKVQWNAFTQSYVMWAVMDNANRTYALSSIMSSPYEDGPFYFRRSFYPDGNRTRDQVIFRTTAEIDNVKVVLGRTYYLTVEYIMPEAIMQPVWESVKGRGTGGGIDYRANYHRAWYEVGYDNYNDIYLQRWRQEDIPWNVTCVNKLTNAVRTVPYGTYTSSGTICEEPDEYKITHGQGSPIITSRFVSPLDYNYSWWRPTSVPSVKSQPWEYNYQDGFCGIRILDDDFEILDPDLDTFEPKNRINCSNIADNPIFTTHQDKLIGLLRVLTTRRAKFMAISELTDDYMDTTGRLNSIEGELKSGQLISMISEMNQFGLEYGEEIQSTFVSPGRANEFDTANDYKYRFKQYINNYNDRAAYALACVLDGVCPVNFRDQVTAGNN